jgi:hypothetical protein
MLGRHERRILRAFVDAMIPPADDGLGPSGLEARVPAKLEGFLEALPPLTRRLFPFALWVVELYPLALGPRAAVFSSLSRRERTRVLVRLEHHVLYPIRSAYYAIKIFTFLIWAEHPVVARATGWGVHCT